MFSCKLCTKRHLRLFIWDVVYLMRTAWWRRVGDFWFNPGILPDVVEEQIVVQIRLQKQKTTAGVLKLSTQNQPRKPWAHINHRLERFKHVMLANNYKIFNSKSTHCEKNPIRKRRVVLWSKNNRWVRSLSITKTLSLNLRKSPW